MTSTQCQKIMKAYPFFVELDKRLQISETAEPIVKQYMLSRWVLGILHSSSRLCDYEEYKKILQTFEASKHCNRMLSFPNVKMKLIASLYKFGPYVFYKVNRALMRQ